MVAKLLGLRETLSRSGLKQKDIADALGVSPQAVWLWAEGKGMPDGSNLVRLVRFLQTHEPGLTLDDLTNVAQRMPQ
jgi:transcriptional regulator with XRE-family HTH domain